VGENLEAGAVGGTVLASDFDKSDRVYYYIVGKYIFIFAFSLPTFPKFQIFFLLHVVFVLVVLVIRSSCSSCSSSYAISYSFRWHQWIFQSWWWHWKDYNQENIGKYWKLKNFSIVQKAWYILPVPCLFLQKKDQEEARADHIFLFLRRRQCKTHNRSSLARVKSDFSTRIIPKNFLLFCADIYKCSFSYHKYGFPPTPHHPPVHINVAYCFQHKLIRKLVQHNTERGQLRGGLEKGGIISPKFKLLLCKIFTKKSAYVPKQFIWDCLPSLYYSSKILLLFCFTGSRGKSELCSRNKSF